MRPSPAGLAAARAPGDVAQDERPRPRITTREVAGVGLVFLVLTCLAFWPVLPWDPDRIVACACGDSVQQAWFLRWVPFAISHGHDPLFSTWMNAPDGVNLGVNTSMPLLGLLGWPVTATLGSVAAFNVLLRVGIALTALSMHLVLRGYVRTRTAAFLGALLFAMSPYLLGEGRIHVFLVFLPLLPPLVPLLDRWLVRADRSPWRCGALVGLCVGLEALISVELAALFVILAVIALLPLAVRHARLVPSRLSPLLRGSVAAALTGGVVGGYPLWMFLRGPQRPQGPPHSVANLQSFHADALSLVLPSRPQLLRAPFLRDASDAFVKGVVHENGFYLGLPLLVVLVVVVVRLRRHPLVLSMATLGVVSFVLGLGTELTVAGHATGIPLPLAALSRVPALQEIGPTRFSLPIQVVAAVLLSLGVDRALRRRPSGVRRAGVLAAVAVVAIVPNLPGGLAPTAPVPASTQVAARAVQQVPAGATVLPYPYAWYTNNDAMIWQIRSDLRFRMPGGEIYVPGPDGTSTNYPRGGLPHSLWAVLVQGGPGRSNDWRPPTRTPRPALVATLRTYVARHGTDAVVVASTGRQGRWVASLARTAFGEPTSRRGDVLVWSDPRTRR